MEKRDPPEAPRSPPVDALVTAAGITKSAEMFAIAEGVVGITVAAVAGDNADDSTDDDGAPTLYTVLAVTTAVAAVVVSPRAGDASTEFSKVPAAGGDGENTGESGASISSV